MRIRISDFFLSTTVTVLACTFVREAPFVVFLPAIICSAIYSAKAARRENSRYDHTIVVGLVSGGIATLVLSQPIILALMIGTGHVKLINLIFVPVVFQVGGMAIGSLIGLGCDLLYLLTTHSRCDWRYKKY